MDYVNNIYIYHPQWGQCQSPGRIIDEMNSLVMKLFICLLGLALASFRSDRLLVGGQLSRLIRRLGIIIHPAVSLLHQACKTGDVVSCTKPILMESKSNAPRSIAGPVIVSSDPHPRFWRTRIWPIFCWVPMRTRRTPSILGANTRSWFNRAKIRMVSNGSSLQCILATTNQDIMIHDGKKNLEFQLHTDFGRTHHVWWLCFLIVQLFNSQGMMVSSMAILGRMRPATGISRVWLAKFSWPSRHAWTCWCPTWRRSVLIGLHMSDRRSKGHRQITRLWERNLSWLI